MNDVSGESLTEAEAARVWELSAELQAKADGLDREPARTEVSKDATPDTDDEGYSLVEVRAAAIEAGIATEYVDSALAEIRAAKTLGLDAKGHALASAVLGRPPSVLGARHTIDASPQAVLEAMQEVMLSPPFSLALTDRRGDPLAGGELVFDLPGVKSPFERGFAFDTADSGLKRVFVSLHVFGDHPDRCEIVVRSPVTTEKIGLGLGTAAGVLGATALGATGLATGLGPLALIGGALAGGGLGLKGFRWLYHGAMRRSEGALNRLVTAIGARATGGMSFLPAGDSDTS